jgi:4-hydroxy-tetrahydrodipicolinate synthase
MNGNMRGIYAIPPTPYNDDYSIDEGGVKSLVDFCIAAGCHGIVGPVNASEFTSLTDGERRLIVEITAKQVNGRVPYAAGVSGVSAPAAVMFAKHAADAGADAVIAMPPYINKEDEDGILKYYEAIAESAGLPVFIQNYTAPVGTPLPAKLLMRLIKEIPGVDYIKEETQHSGHVISECVEISQKLPAGKFKGVMGGKAGRYLLDEYRRGASGSMPACEVCDIQADIWNALEDGRENDAAAIFNKVIALLNFEALYGPAVYKAVLRRRGVIKNAGTRLGGAGCLDGFDMIELRRIMEYIKPMFRV